MIVVVEVVDQSFGCCASSQRCTLLCDEGDGEDQADDGAVAGEGDAGVSARSFRTLAPDDDRAIGRRRARAGGNSAADWPLTSNWLASLTWWLRWLRPPQPLPPSSCKSGQAHST